MSYESLIKYLEYIRDLCSTELLRDDDIEEPVVEKELQSLQSRLMTEGFVPEITEKVHELNIDKTLSPEDETRYFYGLIPRIWTYRDKEKRKRGLMHLKGKIDHLIVEIKMHT